ncbi:hypothetical protein DRQ25_00820 [Candidatus Fermentibacteria bacterium]|nr:MAG: hypothetical protein DRQ25_00820 [Candidatus Fermentibacteria bacterium]
MNVYKNKENIGVIGEYTCFSLAPWIKKGDKVLDDLRRAARTNNKRIIDALKATGIILEIKEAKNLIPTTGRNVLARLLTGDPTYSGEVDWGALGSGTTPFTNASTQLNTEVFRSQADSQAFDDNIAYIDWFIAAGDVADQTFEEFGAFIDGSGAADSGQAWSLLITGGWVKSGAVFISGKYTFI